MAGQFITQLKAVAVSFVWSAVASSIVFFIIKYTVGLKASEEVQEEGLDIAEHGERAYHY
jgi:Amt family ammonium transporter